jgi:2-polyprenyl-3-methyl-5-hydroxy-6-metoxy-1,4-benzoquinol methylase
VSETEIQIAREEGIVRIRRERVDEPFEVTLLPSRPDLYVPRRSCKTTFSVEMIQYLLDRSNFAWLCDNIARHEDPASVPGALRRQLFSYFRQEDFVGRRLLDFGCGNGASSFAMARMLPQTEITGVELDAERIDTASRIKDFRGIQNISFLCSPSGESLPSGVGKFDFVMLSAVFEHLLPQERKTVMPLIWSVMKPGAAIFVNQTPYRYSLCEAHSTGLWLINYMPNKLAHFTVRHFARRNPAINKSRDWNTHLRGGLRGGTEKEIVGSLTGGDPSAALVLKPQHNGIRDRADLWLSSTNPNRFRSMKKLIARGFRLTDHVLGTIPALNLEVVIQKQRE